MKCLIFSNAIWTFDVWLKSLETAVPFKTSAFVSIEDLNATVNRLDSIQDETQLLVPRFSSQNLLNHSTAKLAPRLLSLPILFSLCFCFLWRATIAPNSNISQKFLFCARLRSGHYIFPPKNTKRPVTGPKLSTVVSLATLQEKSPPILAYHYWKRTWKTICANLPAAAPLAAPLPASFDPLENLIKHQREDLILGPLLLDQFLVMKILPIKDEFTEKFFIFCCLDLR